MDAMKKEEYYTYKDYLTWDGDTRWELIDGVPYMMSPTPNAFHQEISGELFRQIANFLDGKNCKVYAAPFDVRLNPDTYDDTVVQPDITVICDPSKLDDHGCKGAPDIAIEILSPSTSGRDKVIKFNEYLKAGVKEYWIIDPEDKTLLAYILYDEKYFVTPYLASGKAPVHALEGCVINLAKVFGEPEKAAAESDQPEDGLGGITVEALRRDGLYTYKDYLTWDSDTRWELIDGVPYMMSPGSNRFHQKISWNLCGQLNTFLKGKKCEAYAAPFDVRLNPDTYDDTVIQPDITVICDPSKLDDHGCNGAPDMVIEILPPSNHAREAALKLNKYLRAGVREYWIIDPVNKILVIHILNGDIFNTKAYASGGEVAVAVLEGCAINLDEVFEGIPGERPKNAPK